MRIGCVIGRTTLAQQDPGLKGGRFLIVSPVRAEHLNSACTTPPPPGPEPSVVVYDNLGAGDGDIIGFVEGAEATAPFPNPIPIDALNIAILDHIHHQPVG